MRLEPIHRAFLAEPQVATEVASTSAVDSPVAVDPGSLVDKTHSFLRKQFSVVLKLPAQKIDPAAPLDQYGIDSIVAIELDQSARAPFGSLPKTLFFEYRSVRDLARHLIECHADKLTTPVRGRGQRQQSRTARKQSLQVTSAGGVFDRREVEAERSRRRHGGSIAKNSGRVEQWAPRSTTARSPLSA